MIKKKRKKPKRNRQKLKMQVKNVNILNNRIIKEIKNKNIDKFEKYNDHNFIPYFPNKAY